MKFWQFMDSKKQKEIVESHDRPQPLKTCHKKLMFQIWVDSLQIEFKFDLP